MRGIPTRCSICGVEGEVYGCPSVWDVCVDKDACRERAIANKDWEIHQLKKQLEDKCAGLPSESVSDC